MKALGHWFSNNASSEESWTKTKRQMWAAFYANLSPEKFQGTIDAKMKLLETAVLGIFTFQCPRWPYTPALAKRIDQFQTYMTGRLLRLPSFPYESSSDYFGRLHRAAGRLCNKHGKWSDLWIKRLRSWRDHVGRHPETWSHAILQYRNDAWLTDRRFSFSNSEHGLTAGRTGTRSVRQRVHQRWESGFNLSPNYSSNLSPKFYSIYASISFESLIWLESIL